VIAYVVTGSGYRYWSLEDGTVLFADNEEEIAGRGAVSYGGGSDIYRTALATIDGEVSEFLDERVRGLEGPDWGGELVLLVASLGVWGAYGLTERSLRGGTRFLAKKLFTRPQRAKALVSALRKEGREVVVNIGGEAAAHEVEVCPYAINVNPITKGRRTDIPNLIRSQGEKVGELFEAGSVDRIVSWKLPTSVDPAQLAKGSVKILRAGGRMDMRIFGGDTVTWGKVFTETLVREGISRKGILNIGDLVFEVVK